MAVIKCPDCQKEVSESAASCPFCGRKIKSSKKWIIILLIIFIGIPMLGIGGCVACGGLMANGVNEAIIKEQQKKAEMRAKGPELIVEAPQLVSEYKANEVSADAKYKGRFFRVCGVVQEIAKDIADDSYVRLEGGDMLRGVQCRFEADKESGLLNLQKGQRTCVQGVGNGLSMNVQLKECEVI